MAARRHGAARIGILLFFLGLYGLTFHGYVDVEDTEVCYQAVANLVDHGSLAIPDTERGRAIVAAGFYVARGADGAHYPIYPLLQLLLLVPGFVLGRAVSGLAAERPDEVVRLVFTSVDVLAGALLCLCVFGLGRRLGQSPRIAAVTALVAGTCTMLWAYAQGTFVDPWLALCTAASALCLLSARLPPDGPLRRALPLLLLAGLLHGLGAQLRPGAYLLLLPVLWFVRHGGVRAVALFLLPVALLAVLVPWLDGAVFGRPPATGLAGHAARNAPVPTSSWTLSLLGLLASDGRGLFTLSPVLLLGALAWPRLRRTAPRAAWLIAGQLLVLALFFAAFDGWHGGWCWGPRYLLPTVPLLAALVGCWLARRGVWRRALALGLVAASLGIQVLSVAVPHRIYLVVATSSDAHLDQFVYYSRYSPVLAHARILAHKLRGEPDVYSLQGLFGLDDATAIAVDEVPRVEVNRHSAGFWHFAWVRVHEKGHAVAAWIAALGSAGAMAVGLRLLLRGTRAGAAAVGEAGAVAPAGAGAPGAAGAGGVAARATAG